MTRETAAIAVLSDSHGQLVRLEVVAGILRDRGIGTVFHCGDITTPSAVDTLADFEVHWVFGNCDWDEGRLRAAMSRWDHTCHGLWGEVEVGGRRVAFTHGHRFALFKSLLATREFDLVFHGHTHDRRDEIEDGTRVICPGALHHADPPGFVILTLPDLEAHWVVVS
ncbi:MAG: metallophosphatase family protein [Thermoanaerobaculales bacterium]|nr:metallophosphatase family protein [Thermoanaerobaculales bacterium]